MTSTVETATEIRPFHVEIPDKNLEDLRRRTEDVMRDLGFDAIVSLSLVAPGLPDRLRIPEDDPRHAPIRVSNPLSVDHSELRTTLLGSLLDAASFNRARGAYATVTGYVTYAIIAICVSTPYKRFSVA